MSNNNEIKNLANEIMDFIVNTITDDVCIDCQTEMIEEIIRKRINQMKGARK